jgi:hypothetical protein
LKWSTSVIISDSASPRARASAIAFARVSSKYLRLESEVRGVGQALVAHRVEILLEGGDLLLGGRQPLLERLIVLLHLLGRLHQAFDDRPHRRLVGGDAELLGHVDEAFGVVRGGAGGGADHRHDLLDLAHHLRADAVDAVGEAVRRDVGLVDLVDVGFAERAVARQELVDHLIQRGIIAGGVVVPDFEMTRCGRLAQRPDLTESNLSERHRAFVLIGVNSHRLAPPAGLTWPCGLAPMQTNMSGGVETRSNAQRSARS